MDPQVQIRIIEIAWQCADKTHVGDTGSAYIRKKMELFDQAYKAMLKTVEPESKAPKVSYEAR